MHYSIHSTIAERVRRAIFQNEAHSFSFMFLSRESASGGHGYGHQVRECRRKKRRRKNVASDGKAVVVRALPRRPPGGEGRRGSDRRGAWYSLSCIFPTPPPLLAPTIFAFTRCLLVHVKSQGDSSSLGRARGLLVLHDTVVCPFGHSRSGSWGEGMWHVCVESRATSCGGDVSSTLRAYARRRRMVFPAPADGASGVRSGRG